MLQESARIIIRGVVNNGHQSPAIIKIGRGCFSGTVRYSAVYVVSTHYTVLYLVQIISYFKGKTIAELCVARERIIGEGAPFKKNSGAISKVVREHENTENASDLWSLIGYRMGVFFVLGINWGFSIKSRVSSQVYCPP